MRPESIGYGPRVFFQQDPEVHSSALDSELPALPRTKSTSANTDPDIVGQLHQNQDPVTCICKSFLSGC
jgi:hypothetical protein